LALKGWFKMNGNRARDARAEILCFPVEKVIKSEDYIRVETLEPRMNLLVTYLACLLVTQSAAIGIGLAVDRMYSSYGGLVVFLVLYFAMFWVAWKVAVHFTEPKSAPASPPRA